MEDSNRTRSPAAAWDAMAPCYDAERTSDPVYRACIRQAVADLRPAGTVLDCGCGTGLATPYLMCADSVHAVDVSEEMLVRARGQVPAARAAHRARRRVPPALSRRHVRPRTGRQCTAAPGATRSGACRGRDHAHAQAWRPILRQRAPLQRGQAAAPAGRRRGGRAATGATPATSSVTPVPSWPHSSPVRMIRAMGFYGLPAQRLISSTAGHVLARLGRGHMLSAYGVAH